MSGLNVVNIVGNLTKDPEQKPAGQTGEMVTAFTVAVDGYGKDKTDFFRVSVWGKRGENCKKYLSKGKMVGVTGEVHVSAYTGQDGKPRASLEVTAQNVAFLSPKGDNGTQDTGASAQGDGFVRVDEEELPF